MDLQLSAAELPSEDARTLEMIQAVVDELKATRTDLVVARSELVATAQALEVQGRVVLGSVGADGGAGKKGPASKKASRGQMAAVLALTLHSVLIALVTALAVLSIMTGTPWADLLRRLLL